MANNTTRGNRYTPVRLMRGSSTAVSTNIDYRLGKLEAQDLLDGVWLDCGCADGGYTRALSQRGVKRVFGIDIETVRVIDANKKMVGPEQIYFSSASSEALPFRTASFDGVFLNEVLEHVSNESVTFQEILRVLRPGGYLALMSPNRWFPFEGHGMQVGKIKLPFPVPLAPWLPGKFTVNFMSARNYWPGELRTLVSQAGFKIIKTCSIFPVFEVYPWLPPLLIRWYRKAVPVLERVPFVRRFGVSTFILAQCPKK